MWYKVGPIIHPHRQAPHPLIPNLPTTTRSKMSRWTEERDRRLLLSLFAANIDAIKIDHQKLSDLCGGTTKDGVDHRFRVLKKEARKLLSECVYPLAYPHAYTTDRKHSLSEGTGEAPATPNKRTKGSSPQSGRKAKREVSPTPATPRTRRKQGGSAGGAQVGRGVIGREKVKEPVVKDEYREGSTDADDSDYGFSL